MASIDRRSNGRWRARWRAPSGESRSRIFDKKVDAVRFLATVEHTKASGGYIDTAAGRITVAEWWDLWWPTCAPTLRPDDPSP